MLKSPWLFWFMLGLLAISVVACDEDDDVEKPNAEKTVAEIAADDAQFSTLVAALERVGLVEVLNGTGPFTVFAPTNAAFTALGIDLNTLSDDALKEILLYHVFGGQAIKAADIPTGQTYLGTAADTGLGNTNLSLLVEPKNGSVILNGEITVTTADVVGKNGVIHVIDGVLLPLDVVGHATANSNFTELVAALGNASGNLVSVLQGDGPFTVFAPLNSAFQAISSTVATLSADQLAAVLTYHVVSGANVRSNTLTNGQVVKTVNGQNFTINIGQGVTITDATGATAKIVLTDVQATNGVIHVLDKVILPNL